MVTPIERQLLARRRERITFHTTGQVLEMCRSLARDNGWSVSFTIHWVLVMALLEWMGADLPNAADDQSL